jgi:hypothetical protein
VPLDERRESLLGLVGGVCPHQIHVVIHHLMINARRTWKETFFHFASVGDTFLVIAPRKFFLGD